MFTGQWKDNGKCNMVMSKKLKHFKVKLGKMVDTKSLQTCS